jgi:hypothetical protein
VVFGGTCLIVAFLLLVLGFLADLMATNRRLIERIEWRVRKLEWKELPNQSDGDA